MKVLIDLTQNALNGNSLTADALLGRIKAKLCEKFPPDFVDKFIAEMKKNDSDIRRRSSAFEALNTQAKGSVLGWKTLGNMLMDSKYKKSLKGKIEIELMKKFVKAQKDFKVKDLAFGIGIKSKKLVIFSKMGSSVEIHAEAGG